MKKIIFIMALVLFSPIITWGDEYDDAKATIGKMPPWDNAKQINDAKEGLRQPEDPKKKAQHDDAINTSNNSPKTSNNSVFGAIGGAVSMIGSLLGI
jgi:hypothetical protein